MPCGILHWDMDLYVMENSIKEALLVLYSNLSTTQFVNMVVLYNFFCGSRRSLVKAEKITLMMYCNSNLTL